MCLDEISDVTEKNARLDYFLKQIIGCTRMFSGNSVISHLASIAFVKR